MNDFFQAVIKFLIKTIIKAVLALGLAFVLIGLSALDGSHIGWWSAYAISLVVVFAVLWIIDHWLN